MAEKILIVEDEAVLLETLRYNLARQGYDVATAADGRLALEVARREHPDLILLDVMLPGLDGLEVCRTDPPGCDVARPGRVGGLPHPPPGDERSNLDADGQNRRGGPGRRPGGRRR